MRFDGHGRTVCERASVSGCKLVSLDGLIKKNTTENSNKLAIYAPKLATSDLLNFCEAEMCEKSWQERQEIFWQVQKVMRQLKQ